MQGPDLISIVMSGVVKPLLLASVIGVLFLFLRNRSAALKHFCLLMGMISLLILPVSGFLIPDIDWVFPFSDRLFDLIPFAWQEYLLKTSYTPVNPFWWQLVLMIYCFVSTSMMFYLVVGFIQFWKISARAKPVIDADTLALADEISDLYGIKRKINLMFSGEINTPCVWGFINPRILFPESYQDWAYEQKVSVLMHEIGHIHRQDALSLLIVKITCAVFWFLFPVWWFAKKMARDSEMACDDLIYRLRDKQVQYAEHLLTFADHSTRDSGAVVSMLGKSSERSEIYQRIMAILDTKKPRQTVEPESVQYLLIIGFLLVMSLGALDRVTLDSVAQSQESTSVFNLEWAKVNESPQQHVILANAEATLASVELLQSRTKPILIPDARPKPDNTDFAIKAEYRHQMDIESSIKPTDLSAQSLVPITNRFDYRSLESIQPRYPESAQRKGLTGFVKIVFDLDATGVPINIRITESHPAGVFDQSVIQAVQQSRFEWLEKNSSHSAIQQHFVFQLDTRRKR